MAPISRRNFLKATVAGSAAASGCFAFHPNYEALAASTSPEEERYSHCVMCNHGPHCGIRAIVKDEQVIRIEKRENYFSNNLCSKGITSLQEMYDPHRLLYPQKRTTPKGSDSPEWEQITWEEALETIATKLNSIKAEYGAEKVMFCTGDPKEPRSAVQRLAFNFGTPNMGTESSTCYKATELATKLIYGTYWPVASSLATGAGPAAGSTKVCIIWGNNGSWSQAFSYAGMKTIKEGDTCKYILVDPRVTPNTMTFADVHLQIRPGTDGALALCFGNHLIENDAYDKDFIENWAHGFDEYKEYVKEFTIERTAEICGIDASLIQEACDILVTQGAPIRCKASAAYPHHTNGCNNWRAAQLLVPLTGSLDVTGGAAITNEPIYNADEWWGSMGFSGARDILPTLDHLRVDRDYFPVWADTDQQGSVQLNRIPEYVDTGAIRAFVMFGNNAMMWPQTQLYQQAFDDADITVAIDMAYRPWTHDHCDIILPAAVSFERMAPLTISGRNYYLREPIVEPTGEARSDYRICCDLGTALGMGDLFWNGGPDAEEECMKEIIRTLGVTFTLDDLRAAAPGAVAEPMIGTSQNKKYELGLCREDGQVGFSSPSGKVEFSSEILKEHGFEGLPVYIEPLQSPISTPELYEEYPLILNTGSRVPMYTHSKERDMPWLRSLMPDPVCRMHPDAAAERGIVDGDDIILYNQMGEIAVKAWVTNIVRPDTIDMFHGWEDADVNKLVTRDFDPISGFPPFKSGLCNIKKA